MTLRFGPQTIVPGATGFGPQQVMIRGPCTVEWEETGGTNATLLIQDYDAPLPNIPITANTASQQDFDAILNFQITGNGSIVLLTIYAEDDR